MGDGWDKGGPSGPSYSEIKRGRAKARQQWLNSLRRGKPGKRSRG